MGGSTEPVSGSRRNACAGRQRIYRRSASRLLLPVTANRRRGSTAAVL